MSPVVVPAMHWAVTSDVLDPTTLSNLIGWWKGDVGVQTDVDGVYQWDDQTASGYDWAQSTGSAKPQVVSSFQNSLDGVQCDGTDDGMDQGTGRSFSGTPFTVAMVVRPDLATNSTELLASDTNNDRIIQHAADDYRWVNGGTTQYSNADDFVYNVVYVIVLGRDSSGNLFCYKNDSDVGASGNNSTARAFRYLFQDAGGPYGDHTLGEMLIYDADHEASASDLAGYLNDRWAVY